MKILIQTDDQNFLDYCVSELNDKIPYSEYIIWCDYDEMVNKILEIQNNYDFFYNKIFNQNLLYLLTELNLNNKLYLKMINRI